MRIRKITRVIDGVEVKMWVQYATKGHLGFYIDELPEHVWVFMDVRFHKDRFDTEGGLYWALDLLLRRYHQGKKI